MGKAKQIILKIISSKDANLIVKKFHYSGKVVNNSQLHFGIFLNNRCGGAMSFGPPLDKRKMLGLVKGTLWNELLELNRMAFADWLPRNSESRAISCAIKFIKKNYPWIKWIVSFADATQCGDGTIYRASGFCLTGIKVNDQIWEAPSGEKFSRTSLTDGRSKQQQQQAKIIIRATATKSRNIKDNGAASMKKYSEAGWKPKKGFQLRYIYFVNPKEKENLTVPILSFSEIEKRGASMYKGKSIKRASSETIDTLSDQLKKGGETPTDALHLVTDNE